MEALIPKTILLTRSEQVISELDDIDQLVRQYRARLLRIVVYSIGDADLAESIVQDCFLKAYAARSSFRGDCSVQSWLLRIALNLVRDHQRTQKFRFWRNAAKTASDISDVAFSLPSAESSPEAQMIAHERARQVHQATQSLSPNQRTAFLLRFVEEMDIDEIAKIMHSTPNTVKTHVHRAVKAVRAAVGGPS